MGLRINTNTAGLNVQFNLQNSNKGVFNAMEKLTSGYKINKSADDAAGLAISENLRANIRNLKQADKNAQDAISLTHVAEESVSEIGNILIRLRELAVQSASDTVSEVQRSFIGLEYNQMLQEIDRIANTTEFNGIKLLLGTGERIDFQVNTRNTETVDRISFDPAQADMTITSLGLENSGVNDKFLARETIKKIDQASNNINELRATFGSIQNRLISTTDNIIGNLENVSAAHSRIRDTDIAVESSELAKKNLMLQSGTAILAQANQLPGQALSLLNKG